MQGWAVIWKIEENRKSGDSPEVAFVGNGIWEKLVTSKNTDYVETFNFAYHIFNHIFMIKKGKGKNFS